MAVRVGPEKDYNWSYPGSNKDVPTVKVFRPTMEEFRDFNKYMEKIESQGSFHGGVSKIIPPKEWVPRKKGYDIDNDKKIGNLKIPAPICQVVNGNRGIFQSINVQKRKMTVKEYKKMALSDRYKAPPFTDYEDLERKYWKNVTFVAPIYGADVNGSITDKSCKEWSIQKLGSILDTIDSDYNVQIAGVNTAYLYFGSWKSSFAWHTEDLDLHSINHLHFGASKFWYTIPPEYGRRFERLADGLFPNLRRECPAFLRHKMCVISPSILRQNSIPYNKVVQQAGDIMITYPFGYHSGFNCGFNGAESTNFATPRWVEFGKRASRCYCKVDMVNISMDAFVKRYQPERYDKWLAGLDVDYHPADIKKKGPMTAAPPPSREEFLVNKTNSQEDIPDCVLNPTKKWLKRHLVHKSHGRMMGGVVTNVDSKPSNVNPEDCEEDMSDTSSVASDISKDSSDLEAVRLARTDDIDDYDYEALEDIWLKAGEVDPDDVGFADDEYRSRRKTRQVCGVCEGCLRLNCGLCASCQDMPVFGGAGKVSQDCERRICSGRDIATEVIHVFGEDDGYKHSETTAINSKLRNNRKTNVNNRRPVEDEIYPFKTDESSSGSDDDEEPEEVPTRKWNVHKRKTSQLSSKRKYKTEIVVVEKAKKVKVDINKLMKEKNSIRKKVRIKIRDGREEMKDLVRIESDSFESELEDTPKLSTTPVNPHKLLPFKKPYVDGESKQGSKTNGNESFESEFMQWCNGKGGAAIAVNMGLPSPKKQTNSPPLPKKQPSSPSKPMIRIDYDKIQSPTRSPKKYDGWITKPSPDDINRSDLTRQKINLDGETRKNIRQGNSITDAIRDACIKGNVTVTAINDKSERSPPAPFGGLQSTIARLMNRTSDKRTASPTNLTSTLIVSNGRIVQSKVGYSKFPPSETLPREKFKVGRPISPLNITLPRERNKLDHHTSPPSTSPRGGNKDDHHTSPVSATPPGEKSRSLLKPAILNPNLKLNEPPVLNIDDDSDIEDVNIPKLEVLRSTEIHIQTFDPNIKASKNSLAPSPSPGEDQASPTGETETERMTNKILHLLQAAGISSQPIGILERVDMGEPRHQQHLALDKSKIHLLLAQLQHAQQLKNQLSSQHQEVLELSSSSRRMSACSLDQTYPSDPSLSPNQHPISLLTSNPPPVDLSLISRLPVDPSLPICPRSPSHQGQFPQQSYSRLRLLLSKLSLHALRSLEHQLLLVGSLSSQTNFSNQTSYSQTSSSQGSPFSSKNQTLLSPTLGASRSYSTPPSVGRTSQTPLSPPRNLQSTSQMPAKRHVCSSSDIVLEPWTARLSGSVEGAVPPPTTTKARSFDIGEDQLLQMGMKLDNVNTIKPRRWENTSKLLFF